MAYIGDQLQSVDPTKPLDTDAESTGAQILRDIKAAILGWCDVEHWRTGRHKRWYGVDSGGVNAYQITIPHTITNLDAGITLIFVAGSSNTSASTLEVIAGATSLGVVAIRASGGPVPAGYIVAGHPVEVVYDGTYWQMVNAPTAVTISGGGPGNFNYITGTETTGLSGSLVVMSTTVAMIGNILIPVNSYSQLKVEVEIAAVRASGGAVNWNIYLNSGSTTLKIIQLTVPASGYTYLSFSHIFAGGQTAITSIDVKGASSSSSFPQTAAITAIRLYGIS